MADIVAWRFLLFVAVFGFFLYLQFYLAHRQWRRLKGEQAGEIDVNYVRSESYFAQSFRLKVKNWLNLPASKDQDGTLIMKGKERIRVQAGTLDLGADAQCDDILVIERDFSCGSGCTLRREVLVHGDATVGTGSFLQSLAADGQVTLGENTGVARWLDGSREVTLSAGCYVGSRVTSLARIRLGLGSEVSSAWAPEVATAGWDTKFANGEPPPRALLVINFLEDLPAANEALAAAGLRREQILQLGVDTWLYKGDLVFSTAVRVVNKLVVKGNCYFPEGSVLEADLKAAGCLFLGPSCSIRGNLVADGHMHLGAGCRFAGLLHAGKTLLLSRGSRGFQENGMIAAYAQDGLSVETDVAVKGKLASGNKVTVVNPAAAKAWRDNRGIQVDGSLLERKAKS